MTRRESAILSAFTGILCGPFDAVHEYIEQILGRPVFTHELADKKLFEVIKEKAEPDFLNIVKSIDG